MKKRRFFALFLVLGLLVSLLSVPASAFEEIDVDARAALLVEKETGEILYEKNAHEKNYPASITKLTVTMESMSKDLINDREKSRDAHKNIWAGIEAVEKKNTEQDLTLSNHEQRIKVLEKG